MAGMLTHPRIRAKVGQIEPGELADILVANRDYFRVSNGWAPSALRSGLWRTLQSAALEQASLIGEPLLGSILGRGNQLTRRGGLSLGSGKFLSLCSGASLIHPALLQSRAREAGMDGCANRQAREPPTANAKASRSNRTRFR